MGLESLRVGGQARTSRVFTVRWVSITTATQMSLLKIDADGVQCGLPEALGSGRCRQGLLFQGPVAWEALTPPPAMYQGSAPRVALAY